MKINKILTAITATSCGIMPLSACSSDKKIESTLLALAKNSFFVGDVLLPDNFLVTEDNREIAYDKTGLNGFAINDTTYNVGHWFTDEDLGQHEINISYKDAIASVKINVERPRVVTPTFPITDHTSKFFKTPKIANKIYVVDVPNVEPYKSYRSQWYVLLESLEGILAQTEARLFVCHDVPQRNSWLLEAQHEMGLELEQISPEQALTKFGDCIKDHKIVTYSMSDASINNATNISAVEQYLMCDNDSNFLNKIKSFGFTEAIDSTKFTSKEVFNKYQDVFNKTMLFNQVPTNIWLRDYAIASKSFITSFDIESEEFKEEILEWADDNCPVLGWSHSETKTVTLLSEYNKVAFPSDNCANLSFYTAYSPKENHYQVHNSPITPEAGKHYVAIVMSDGDNVQWLQNDWWEERWFGNQNRGLFPMTWTLNPSTLDLNPQILDRLMRYRTLNDYFVCSGSGYGYIYFSKFTEREKFSASTVDYMKNNDMNILYLLEKDEKEPENYQEMFEQDQIKGGIWAYGDKYAAGKGGLYWINDKPLVCCRETLWNEGPDAEKCFEPVTMAKRINNYTCNYNSINGYTIINCHCWSYGEMNQIKKMVDNLDKHVQVITAEQLIDMVTKYVPKDDVEAADKYPWYYDK